MIYPIVKVNNIVIIVKVVGTRKPMVHNFCPYICVLILVIVNVFRN